METDPAVWISELRASQQRQAELVGRLTPEELRRPSYDRDWTVAQLLSHMGSGGEITSRRLAGALAGAPALRLNEHALHSWDTAVSFDPGARIAQGSVPLLLDNLLEGPEWIVARMTRGGAAPEVAAKLGGRPVLVHTTAPERRITIELAGKPRCTRPATTAAPTWSSPRRRCCACATAASTRPTPPPASRWSPHLPRRPPRHLQRLPSL